MLFFENQMGSKFPPLKRSSKGLDQAGGREGKLQEARFDLQR